MLLRWLVAGGVAASAAAAWVVWRRRGSGPDPSTRYRAENARLPAPAASEARVVFIGDSITELWGQEAGGFFPGRPFVNRGVKGETTRSMLERFAADVVALRPRVVVIAGGTNDLVAEPGPDVTAGIRQRLAAMAALARAHDIRVVLATLLPVHDRVERFSASRPALRIEALNAWIRAQAPGRGWTLLDYHTAMVEPDGSLRATLSDDGLHPNAAGYAVMQPLALQAIDAALRRP